MKTEILSTLRNAQDYVSGQYLCDKFGVSRTAVWKCINQLKEAGYEIEGIKNRGYKITTYPDSIDSLEIKSRLGDKTMFKEVYFYDEIDSTNNEAKRLAENGAGEGSVVLADLQTGGKGRRGRVWKNPKKSAIALSYILKPDIPPVCASMITLVVALAAQKSIAEVTGLDCKIKWPNDVVINGKKVCGILTEMSAEADYINYIVPGIGFNVNNEDFDEDIKKTATSLKIETKRYINRADIIEKFLLHFEKFYNIFLETDDLSGLIDIYNSLLVNMDRHVKVLALNNEFEGLAKGITKTGELLVEKDDKEIVKVMSGEVSVRGIYGYV